MSNDASVINIAVFCDRIFFHVNKKILNFKTCLS
jgi:hypothetical protein